MATLEVVGAWVDVNGTKQNYFDGDPIEKSHFCQCSKVTFAHTDTFRLLFKR
jgi:hypothetical protein